MTRTHCGSVSKRGLFLLQPGQDLSVKTTEVEGSRPLLAFGRKAPKQKWTSITKNLFSRYNGVAF